MKVEAPRLEEWIKPQGRQSGIVENGGPTQPFYKPCRHHHLYPFYLDERTWKSFVGFSIGDPFLSTEADLEWSEANPSGLTPLLVTLNTELWPSHSRSKSRDGIWEMVFLRHEKRHVKPHTSSSTGCSLVFSDVWSCCTNNVEEESPKCSWQ